MPSPQDILANTALVNELHETFKQNAASPKATRKKVDTLIGLHGPYNMAVAMTECLLVAYARLPPD